MQVSTQSLPESRRVEVLKNLRILDTEPELCFNVIVNLAAQSLDTPMSAIGLIDDTRQWFKASKGISVSQTSRSAAFCIYTIEGTGVLAVPDALEDPRFRDNPYVQGEPRIRSYLGHPLCVQGQAIGALCVMDTRPRQFTP